GVSLEGSAGVEGPYHQPGAHLPEAAPAGVSPRRIVSRRWPAERFAHAGRAFHRSAPPPCGRRGLSLFDHGGCARGQKVKSVPIPNRESPPKICPLNPWTIFPRPDSFWFRV